MSKILIVDDELEICAFLKEFFSERNYDVVTASSGKEAIQLVNRENPHVLLLDIKMPGIDGLEVLKAVKQYHPNLKVIMVTAVETSDKMAEAFKLGADNYITKPLSLEYLERDVKEKIFKLI
ncbi:MAG: response regulator [Candidatus Omnitrophica bacterium]|nr:response regulator [Candidatus Omnitrophota bacterium]